MKKILTLKEAVGLLRKDYFKKLLARDGASFDEEKLYGHIPYSDEARTELVIAAQSFRIFNEIDGYEIRLVPGKCDFYLEKV